VADNERSRRGTEVRQKLGMDTEASKHRFDNIDPEFSGQVDEYLNNACFGDVWARPGLDLRTRRLLTIAMLAALGRERQLRGHIVGALQQGISREEVLETIVHVIPYAGFPAGLTGLEIFREATKGG
jgi:4-carboxymuconolactone decarboxylase